jgi:hypothetical protein
MKTFFLYSGLSFFLFTDLCLAQIHLPNANDDRKGPLKIKQFLTSSADNNPEESLYQWYPLPSPSNETVTQVSIACDGSEMVIFYRKPDYSLNLDEGPIKKWAGSSWQGVTNLTNECHDPDVDIDGSVVIATWNTDAYDYGYGTNINGPWVSFTGSLLSSQWNPRAAMAMGLPYMSFACRYSDGMPSSYLMLHVIHIVGVGDEIELNGGWRFPYYDIGMNTGLTGDDHAWYCVYNQQGYLIVDKGSIIDGNHEYSDLGDGFRMNAEAYNPEITLFNGKPVVAWLENSGTEIYVAEWNSPNWLVIGSGTTDAGYIANIRMTSGSLLYLVYTINSADENISVNSFDGSAWYGYPSVQDKFSTDISTADIALYNNHPVVAFTQEGKLTVKFYADGTLTNNALTLASDPAIICYPNPFYEYFTVDLGKTYPDISYEIKTITGFRLVRKEMKSAASIHDTFVAAPGVYLIDIFSGKDKISSLKLIKK